MRKIPLYFKRKTKSLHGQGRAASLRWRLRMPVAKIFRNLLMASALLEAGSQIMGQTPAASAAGGVSPLGGEYSVLGAIPGDQVKPSLCLTTTGGVVAWQDNVVDAHGQGIGGVLLNPDGTMAGSTFRVNNTKLGDQLAPLAVTLANGRTLYLWQSKVAGTSDIYARLAQPPKKANAFGTTFYTLDVRVNSVLKDAQLNPAVAALPDGSAVVTWQSYGQDGSGWGVYARHILAEGPKRFLQKKEFLVNQDTAYNQRDPAVTALANGNYVITWISEREKSAQGMDVYARVFTDAGTPVTDEIAINSDNSGTGECSSPAVAALNNGGFTVVWNQRDAVTLTNGYDIWGRAFDGSFMPAGDDFRINTYLYGDQFNPKIASGPSGCLVVWTSMGEDGSREGVYGRYISGGTQLAGDEFRVNTTTQSMQIHPTVAWNGVDRFVVMWSSFVGTASGMDLYGQAYSINQ